MNPVFWSIYCGEPCILNNILWWPLYSEQYIVENPVFWLEYCGEPCIMNNILWWTLYSGHYIVVNPVFWSLYCGEPCILVIILWCTLDRNMSWTYLTLQGAYAGLNPPPCIRPWLSLKSPSDQYIEEHKSKSVIYGCIYVQ